MNIDKNQILQLLHTQGQSGQATQADQELPDQVDTDNDDHKNLLQKVGLDPADLISKFTGGGSEGGGLGGMIGKIL